MTLDKAEAGADLAAIEDVVARVRQSRIYRVSGDIVMFWGVVQIAQYFVVNLLPQYPWSWLAVDGVGVLATVVLLRRAGGSNRVTSGRMLATYVLFYGFGFLWSAGLGQYHGPAVAVFWHTLFLFGISVAGVWFGVGFLGFGLVLSALIVLIYLYAGAWFWLLLALTTGFGYISVGLWMRRA